MERRTKHSSSKQDLIVHEYLANKAIPNTNLCPSNNTPSSKLLSGGSSVSPTKAIKVLPPLKPTSSSLERVSGGQQNILHPIKRTTEDLNRVELFKKRDLRGGKRKQTHLSVGKTAGQTQRTSSLTQVSAVKSERKILSIAQGSPSTQEDSQRRTNSSRGGNSTNQRSNENLYQSPQKFTTCHASALQVIENLEFVNPMEEMTRRWQQRMESSLPTIDIMDISAEGNPFQERKRQFAPEYSQSSYMTMLQEEYAIGDYINLKNSSIKVTEEARHHMVTLLEELNRLKAYKEETFYLACSLADRYLVNLAVRGLKAPCLIRLAIVCTLMSAKLEQPISPSFSRMIRLVEDEWHIEVDKKDLTLLEEKVIKTLDYELHYNCPIIFFDRYQRIFNIDQEHLDEDAEKVSDLARRFMRCMVGSSYFLRFKVSQIAASAIILAINVHQSAIAQDVGLPGRLQNIYARSFFFDSEDEESSNCPLRHWNAGVRRLTRKCVGKDIKPCYKLMLQVVNEMEFEGELTADPALFIPKQTRHNIVTTGDEGDLKQAVRHSKTPCLTAKPQPNSSRIL